MNKEQFFNYLERAQKDSSETMPVDYVEFPFILGSRLLKMIANRASNRDEWKDVPEIFEAFIGMINLEYDTDITPYLHYLEDVKVSEILALTNEEQKRVALNIFTAEEIIEGGNLELVGKETINKSRIGWSINSEGAVVKDTIEYQDEYSLYKGEVSTRVGAIPYGIVLCNDTSTGEKYYLYTDIVTKRDERGAALEIMTDPIEAIASIHRLLVPSEEYNIEEVYQYIQRQGDVVMGKLKEEYEDVPLKTSKMLNKEQYLNMIVAES